MSVASSSEAQQVFTPSCVLVCTVAGTRLAGEKNSVRCQTYLGRLCFGFGRSYFCLFLGSLFKAPATKVV